MVTILQWLVMSPLVLVAWQGSWQQLQQNVDIASMHSAVTRYDQVILLDLANVGPSQIKLPGGKCRNQPLRLILKNDCWAHSVMFNPRNGAVRPLFVYTDTWCSSGQFMANGVMVQTGGASKGRKKIRTHVPEGTATGWRPTRLWPLGADHGNHQNGGVQGWRGCQASVIIRLVWDLG